MGGKTGWSVLRDVLMVLLDLARGVEIDGLRYLGSWYIGVKGKE